MINNLPLSFDVWHVISCSNRFSSSFNGASLLSLASLILSNCSLSLWLFSLLNEMMSLMKNDDFFVELMLNVNFRLNFISLYDLLYDPVNTVHYNTWAELSWVELAHLINESNFWLAEIPLLSLNSVYINASWLALQLNYFADG